ncbi:unnamed protein product [Dovyalis caffra]|uniref:Peptidase A1 domain-containing protein n=1 Tax=Dovyalis caffra TaxID=77055 RepID=A0AAV1RR70_9ROSI|nr:unnamed protein product [Dovyalis caffra]
MAPLIQLTTLFIQFCYYTTIAHGVSSNATTFLIGTSRSAMMLPLFLSPLNSSTRFSNTRHLLQRSNANALPNARMRLHDDLLINGYYTTRLWIGTPPQRFALIVDTGSTVTYVPCSSCERCGRHQDPKFQPDLSSTYQPLKCNIDCNCDDEKEQCVYERQYAEMSTSSGVLGEDILSFGSLSELAPQRAVFGCENMETGDLYSQHADGIMGLGRGDLSIVDQLVDKGVINDSFSLCYGGMDIGGGAMVFGDISPPSDMVFSQSDPVRSPYYNIDLKEIHVAGKPLLLNPRVFDGKHGTVLDSGTTYAYLPEAAFMAFKDAITKELGSLKPIRGPDPNYNDICFSGAARWAVFPSGSDECISNATALSIIARVAEHRLRLPDTFGSYYSINWNIKAAKRTWWQQHFLLVALAIVVTFVFGLSALGIWFIWKHRQQTLNAYKPVDAVVPEQELQPL